MPPETRYTRSGDVNIAYQVVGDGPLDLVFVNGWGQSFDPGWDMEPVARFYRRLASFSRLILFDKRGTGLSDRVPLDDLPTLETRMDDMRAVMDAVGVERAAVLGQSEGGAMCALFAATYPARTKALVMVGTPARTRWAPDYPLGATDEELEELERSLLEGWNVDLIRSLLQMYGPSIADDEEQVQAYVRFAARGASPTAAAALWRMAMMVDVRHVLPVIRVPTLVLHRADEILADASRYVGERIPGARVVELPGSDHLPWLGDQDRALDEIEEFLTGVRPHPALDRVLATVLFTDIVGSTQLAADLGDRRWRDPLEQHNTLVRGELRPLSRAGAEHGRRRLPGHVRWAGPRDRVRLLDSRCRTAARPPDSLWAPHGGARAAPVRDPRDRRAHGGTGGGKGRARRGAGVEHCEGPGRRLRSRVRRPRLA
jgi:pimeloyl-ACP methyl ester carboxylesterase